MKSEYQPILDFWFGGNVSDLKDGSRFEFWFGGSDDVDQEIKTQFGDVVKRVSEGLCDHWDSDLQGRLALIIVLDQFRRNIFRDRKEAFEKDPVALALTKKTIEKKEDISMHAFERIFLYLPLEHSENLDDQKLSLTCYRKLERDVNSNLTKVFSSVVDFAVKHYELIARFGRFPHRNDVLNRESTPEEIAFLKEHGRGY